MVLRTTLCHYFERLMERKLYHHTRTKQHKSNIKVNIYVIVENFSLLLTLEKLKYLEKLWIKENQKELSIQPILINLKKN